MGKPVISEMDALMTILTCWVAAILADGLVVKLPEAGFSQIHSAKAG
ncbi:hypothetical protein GO003_011575 [Methylicorpusculum oleiharenae]|nr:hypothetical protein [Methylicorpusculum oleiharenae]MCD2451034.1 hypothetical protein [Methylicorpusculum oleiharenae]